MKFCPVCKSIVDEEDLFCSTCGTALQTQSSHHENEPEVVHQTVDGKVRGIILTNTSLLASRFHVECVVITRILRRYIELVSKEVSYELIDLAPLSSCSGQREFLNWAQCHEFLLRQVGHDSNNAPQYLFIIGDNAIVPVPQCIIPLGDGLSLTTDALYAHTLPLDANQQDFCYWMLSQPVNYFVGRLPFGIDATFAQLQNYLERAAAVMETGIPVQMAYAQTTPLWQFPSANVTKLFNEYLPSVADVPGYVRQQMMLSPNVSTDNINNVFNPYANIYYFNLHGSDAKSNAGFYGESEGMATGCNLEAILPEQLNDAALPNIVVTEACFGGKYSGLNNSQSMLLTAIHSSTLLYLGSSTYAIGQNNEMLLRSGMLTGADKLAESFIKALNDGYSGGAAMYLARKELLSEACQKDTTYNLMTAIEFSLYGDPSLHAHFPAKGERKEIYTSGTYYGGLRLHKVENRNHNSEHSSLLDKIRRTTDRELDELKQYIDRELENCGIFNSKLKAVSDFDYGQFRQRIFSYYTGNDTQALACITNDDVTNIHLVTTKQAQIPQIDYETLFQEACERYGLIQYNDTQSPQVIAEPSVVRRSDSVVSMHVIQLDGRMEPKSKKLIDTFNTILDTVYRPKMDFHDIPTVAIKSCCYDFMALVTPLALVLETELKATVVRYLDSRKVARPEGKMTFGKIVVWMKDNVNVVAETHISSDFIKLLEDATKLRNDASHDGDISELDFTHFYEIFLRIMTSQSFGAMMKLKRRMQTRK